MTATPIHLHAWNLFPWLLRTFSLRKYPGNTRDRACEWLRFPDWLEHAQTARAITKKRRLKRSELCKPRYLRNVNSCRNGTCKEDNIVYTYIYAPLILLRVPTGSPSIFMTFFFYFSPPSFFPLLARRIGQERSRIKYQLYFPSDSILKISLSPRLLQYQRPWNFNEIIFSFLWKIILSVLWFQHICISTFIFRDNFLNICFTKFFYYLSEERNTLLLIFTKSYKYWINFIIICMRKIGKFSY